MRARFDSYVLRVRVFTSCKSLPDPLDSTPIHRAAYMRLTRTKLCILPGLKEMRVVNVTDDATICLSGLIRHSQLNPSDDSGIDF
jgi:hypothetical protein